MERGPERWLTVADVAGYLQLSRAKIYELAQLGLIPCSKIAGRWRFSRPDVDAWVRQQSPGRTAGPKEGE